jgi:hypothetical protein
MTDRLTLARALEEGGTSRDAAEHIATEIYDAIHKQRRHQNSKRCSWRWNTRSPA